MDSGGEDKDGEEASSDEENWYPQEESHAQRENGGAGELALNRQNENVKKGEGRERKGCKGKRWRGEQGGLGKNDMSVVFEDTSGPNQSSLWSYILLSMLDQDEDVSNTPNHYPLSLVSVPLDRNTIS